ncbi:MAG: Gfo/Idh/MocA family oxidoreductase [Myxococcota bacterium]
MGGLRLLVVGAGMYVTGRDGTGVGTVLASLCEASRTLPIASVEVIATSRGNRAIVQDKAAELNQRLGTALPIRYRVVGSDPQPAVESLDLDEYDAAIVSVPDALHFAYTHALLEGGLHCLVVKPFVPTLAEAKTLTELARARGRLGMVELHKRYDSSNRFAEQALRDGQLGTPLYSVVRYSQRVAVPTEIFRPWAASTNIFQYLAVHYVDLMWFLLRFRPIRVSAIGTRGRLAEAGIDTPDSVHATIEWRRDDGASFFTQVASNWIDPNASPAISDQRLEIVGTAGRLDLDQRDRGIHLTTERGLEVVNPYFSSLLPDRGAQDRFSGYGHESIRTFIEEVTAIECRESRVEDIDRQRPTFAEALVSTAVIEAANESLVRHGAWIEVSS